MAKSGLRHIDVGAELTKTEWESEESHELIHGTSFPSSPVERQLFYRDDEHKWYIYDGTDWVWLGGGSGGGMQIHGNEYHDPDFADVSHTHSDLSPAHKDAATGVHGVGGSTVESVSGSQGKVDTHKDLTTGIHGVGAGTIAKISDIAVDSNLSSAAQDAIAKKHTQNTDKALADADGDTKIEVEKTADEDKIHMSVKGVEAFLLHDSGIIDLSKQSGAHTTRRTTVQSIPNDTATLVQFNGEDYDVQGEYNPSTYRFTAAKAGKYFVCYGLELLSVADGKLAKGYIFKNGTVVFNTGGHTGFAGNINISGADIIDVAAGDYLEIYVYHNHGSARDLNKDYSMACFYKIA